MGVSTNGEICFGVMFPEGYEFPWGDDIDTWWLAANGYKPPFEMYDSSGNWLNGQEPPREKINEYYDHQRKFGAEHPLPVDTVNYCSGDFPMYILALPGSRKRANRGYPTAFEPQDLVVRDEDIKRLLAFCEKYELKFEGKPAWYLSSYWG